MGVRMGGKWGQLTPALEKWMKKLKKRKHATDSNQGRQL